MREKTILALALSTAAVLGPPAGAQALESRIDAATVYPRGADVTRVAQVSLTAGDNVVRLEGFPGNIDLGRTRATVDDARVELRFIRLDVRQQRRAHDAEIRRLEAAIDEIKDSMEALDDEIAAADLQLKFLEGLAQDYASGERQDAASGEADIASWQQAVESIGSGAGAVLEKMRNARKLRREQASELSALERELENKGGRRADSAALRVSLTADADLDTTLRISYFQSQAGWISSYSAYLDSAASKLRLAHEARISQATGEDWRNVQLRLSTGDPGGAMQAPDQESVFLDVWEYQKHEARSEISFAENEAAGPGAVYERVVLPEESAAPPPLLPDPGRYRVIYQVGGRADVASGTDDAQGVPLAELRVDVSLVTRATPRKSTLAYLSARYKHDSDTPLFGGPMRVFVDGAFAGLATLPELLPGAEAVLPMGPDPQVEVIAVDQGGAKGREGLLSARNTELTDWLFEIVNRHSRAAQVEVVDFLPTPRDERVAISIPGSATKPDEKDWEGRPGVAVWRKSLDPGETWRIAHQYEVSYPRDAGLRYSIR